MKIVFVNNFWRGLGGAEHQTLLVIEGLLKRGVEVRLIAPNDSKIATAARELGADVTECNLEKSENRTSLQTIEELSVNADFVAGTGHWTNLLVSRASLSAKTKKIAIHQSMPDAARMKLERFARRHVMRFGLRKIDGHIAVSKAVKDVLVKQGFSAEKIEVIHNGAPLPPDTFSVSDTKRTSPAGKAESVLGYLGRLEKVKGCDLLLQAFKQVHEATSEVTLKIAGVGSQEEELHKLSDSLGLAESVQFLGWQDTYSFFSNIDVLVAPSRAEAFGLSIVEAQRAGKAIVAFDVGGISEALLSDMTTQLVPAGNTELLAKAIIEMLDRLPQIENELQDTAQLALQKFTPEQTAEAYYRYFNQQL